MNRLASRFRLPVAIVLSFIAGYAFYHYSVTIWNPVYQGNELTNSKVERLRQEVTTFFYQTMDELFEGTHDPNNDHISKQAINSFNEYKSRLEPRCRLINVYYYYGFFESDVLFPSGDRFVALIRKNDKGWRLDSLRYASTVRFVQLDKEHREQHNERNEENSRN